MTKDNSNQATPDLAASRPRWKKAAVAAAVTALVGGGAMAAYLAGPTSPALASPPGSAAKVMASPEHPLADPAAALGSFRKLASKVTPAVVNIATTIKGAAAAKMSGESGNSGASPFPELPPGSPFEQFFKHFMVPGPQSNGPQPEMHALGSGFIISPKGYIVTNNHVIEGASSISVRLANHDKYPAKVVGADPKTDLALLKINAGKPLPYVTWGNSSKSETGDWVMAVGNPFGLGGTVTAGIISARGRDLQEGPYDNFIQIDAPINKGNSGGPTFNMDGQVIGINSAIYSPNGGSVGIGFAIPSNIAKPIIQQLREHGKVERGWIGVEVQTVTPDIANGLGLSKPEGALVVTVNPGGPAAKAGVKSGDVILKVGSQSIPEMRVLPQIVATKTKGSDVPFLIWRNGKEKTLTLTIAPMPANPQQVASNAQGPSSSEPTLGMSLAPLDASVRQQMNIPSDVTGVLVTGVRGDSPAANAGINPGDIIEKVGNSTVGTPEQVASDVRAARAAKRNSVLMMVNRAGQERFVAVPVGKA